MRSAGGFCKRRTIRYNRSYGKPIERPECDAQERNRRKPQYSYHNDNPEG